MKLYKKITFLLLLLTIIECEVVSKDGDDRQIFELNTTATLRWNLNNVVDKTLATVFSVHYNHDQNAFLQLTKTNTVTNTFNSTLTVQNDPFNGRASGNITLNNGTGVLSVELQNVEYKDSGNFTFDFVSTVLGSLPTQEKVDITLDVQGGPSKCGDQDLPKNFTCKEGDEISGSVTLCGKPRPNVSWTIGDQSINGTIDSAKADQHQYTYSFKHNVTSEMCGKSVSYQAKGFQNNEVTGIALIIKDKSEGGGDGGSEGLSGGAIAGIIIGVLVLVVLVALVVLYRLGKIGGGSVAATSEKSPNEQTAMKNENQKV